MSGTRSPEPVQPGGPVRIEAFGAPDALPADAAGLFQANPGLYSSAGWWRTVRNAGMPDGTEAVFLLVRLGERPAGLLPLSRSAGGRLAGLTTPYTCLYQPLLAPELDAAAQRTVFSAFSRYCRRSGATRFDALDADWAGLRVWEASARACGLGVLHFDCFGNWHEPVRGLDWQSYLASRQGALRETIRRRMRRAERDGQACFQLLRDAREIEQGIAAYEAIYARSWKEPEPFPCFNAELIRAGADAGWLRLGVLQVAGKPAAAQLWVVDRGVASVLKLAHDEAFKALSPGTVLTAWMLRHLLDEEHVAEIDFGRGDDGYKQGWAGLRRQRIGLVLANPLRPAGAKAILRHVAGRVRAKLRSRSAGA